MISLILAIRMKISSDDGSSTFPHALPTLWILVVKLFTPKIRKIKQKSSSNDTSRITTVIYKSGTYYDGIRLPYFNPLLSNSPLGRLTAAHIDVVLQKYEKGG